MKIYFSPEYNGHVFFPYEEGKCMADSIVVDTMGLIALLELPLGLHHENMPTHHRAALYYRAMKLYMESHPDNILAQSFALSGLSTAFQTLMWRDALVLDNWKSPKKISSSRLRAIHDIEKSFACPGIPDRLNELIDIITHDQKCSYSDYAIQLPCSQDILHPTIIKLLNLLVERGATISVLPIATATKNNLSKVRNLLQSNQTEKITLDKADTSFQIYQFKSEKDAEEYLALKGDQFHASVWINQNNKSMDNWLRMMGKPTMGSSMTDAVPEIVQMFVIGLSLFSHPLNISSLIDWLYLPIHPLGRKFRQRLADAIIAEGGYYNEACQTVIERYIEGEYEFKGGDEEKPLTEEEKKKAIKEEKKQKEKRLRLAELYLPKWEEENQGTEIDCQALVEFMQNLSAWSRQRMHLMLDHQENILWCVQLGSLADMIDTFLILLDSLDSNTIAYSQIDSWASTIYKSAHYVQYQAQVGSRQLIDQPAKMGALSHTTIWMNFDGDTATPRDLSFLYPSEMAELQGHITHWQIDQEDAYQNSLLLAPFKYTTDQLILTVCDYRGGELTQKHPLMVRLDNQITNLDSFVVRPNLNNEPYEEVVRTHNERPAEYFNFAHSDLVKWPDHLSPTTIGTLVQNPFDYMMERILNLVNYGPGALADIKVTKGNVAHAVIAALFAPRDGKRTATPQEIAKRIDKEYAHTFITMIDAHGAILNLPENKLERKLLNEQLQEQLAILLEIVEENHLEVTGCEYSCRASANLLGPKDSQEPDLSGKIDMTLGDENHHPVVFDFKWTSSRHYYQDLLSGNRSVQLELYRWMLTQEKKDLVERTAYFIMPEGRLYSKEAFSGYHCVQLEPANEDDIATQLRNAVRFRIRQINAGTLEMAETMANETDYMKATESDELFPIECDDEGKVVNKYSNYSLFKGLI